LGPAYQILLCLIKARRIRWAGHVACVKGMKMNAKY
jgi:ribosomal protein L2